MGADDRMILKDLPVDTRNYTIIDNISGKPIDQSNYTLTIDADVIKKLNQLKKMNEEKIKQATLKDQYGDSSLVSTFTPEDNAVFSPMYNDEYIDVRDYREETESLEYENKNDNILEEADVPTGEPVVTQSNSLLARVVARDARARAKALEAEKPQEEDPTPKVELDYISSYDPSYNSNLEAPPVEEPEQTQQPVDNSIFRPDSANLHNTGHFG